MNILRWGVCAALLGGLIVATSGATAQALTTAQASALKVAIQVDPVAGPALTGGQDSLVASRMNETDTGFWVWRTDVGANEVLNVVTWANLTPADAADSTVLYQNRLVYAQSKQLNLWLLLQAALISGSINASLSNLRAGWQDALTNLPTGAGGANVSAGWAAVRDGPFKRNATRAERVLANTASAGCAAGTTAANPACLTFQRGLSADDVSVIRLAP